MSDLKTFEIELKNCFMFACDMYYDFHIKAKDKEFPYLLDVFDDPEVFEEALEDGMGVFILPLLDDIEEYEKEVGEGAYYKVVVYDEEEVWGTYYSDSIEW